MLDFSVKIIVYTFTYNNGDILPFVIDYWKLYATKVVVYDCGSKDGTLGILYSHKFIEVRETDFVGFDLQKIQRIKNRCYKEYVNDTDYVMFCDVNEVLYIHEGLLNNIEYNRNLGINLFNIDYYEVLRSEFPIYTKDKLLQNYDNLKAVKSIKIKKNIIFKPTLIVKFLDNSDNFIPVIESLVKSANLKVLHFFLNADYYSQYYKKFIEHKLNTNCIFNYGKDTNRLLYYHNYMWTLPYEDRRYQLLITKKEQTNGNIIHFNSYNDFINNCKCNVNINKISRNYTIAIVIPVYKQTLNQYEQNSLLQLIKVINYKYDIFIVCPENLYTDYFKNTTGYDFNFVKFNNEYFLSLTTYSYLCESPQFYEVFQDYKYMFLYLLDGWIFEDNLNYFTKSGYDYIGSPWKAGNFECKENAVGNGGVSLRKISKFIEICNNINNEDLSSKWLDSEDLFFCKTIKCKEGNNFNIAPCEIAKKFSIDGNYEYWLEQNEGILPMCIHRYFDKIKIKDEFVDNTIEEKESEDIQDKIIVTFTTWKNRIENAAIIVELILNGTLKPNKIVLNLSAEEFPNMFNDLPIDLLKLYYSEPIFEINWLANNTKVWKKLIPTLCKYQDDVVISIDDDWKYPDDIVSTLYNEYCKNDKKYPISGNNYVYENMNCHCGSGSLTTYNLLNSKNQFKFISNEIIEGGSDDMFYSCCAYENENEYKRCYKQFFTNMTPLNQVNGYSDENNVKIGEIIDLFKNNLQNNIDNSSIIKDICMSAKTKNIKIFIFNYRHNENALKWKNMLSKYYEVDVLDSGNDKIVEEFIQFPNIYYSGLWNIVRNFVEKNNDYEWIGVIPSDITISDDNFKILLKRLEWLKTTSNVGQWQASLDKSSRNWNNNIHSDEILLESKKLLEAHFFFIKSEILRKLPIIDTTINQYGYGISEILSLITIKEEKLNVFDNNLQIHHPSETKYDIRKATEEVDKWLPIISKELDLDYGEVLQASADNKGNSLGIAYISIKNNKL